MSKCWLSRIQPQIASFWNRPRSSPRGVRRVGVLDHGALAQLGMGEPAAQPLVLARGGLSVDQQTKPVLARQFIGG